LRGRKNLRPKAQWLQRIKQKLAGGGPLNEYVIGNFVLNGGLVVLICFLLKRWVNGIEKTAETNRKELAKTTAKTTDELKNAIRENRDEYRDTSQRISDLIKELSDHVATANGRTAKLEGKIYTQMAICHERHGDREVES
jgi:hypothetical protein